MSYSRSWSGLLVGLLATSTACVADDTDSAYESDETRADSADLGAGEHFYAMDLLPSWTLCKADLEDADGDGIKAECEPNPREEIASGALSGFVSLDTDTGIGTIQLCDAALPVIKDNVIDLHKGALSRISQRFTFDVVSADGVTTIQSAPFGIGAGLNFENPLTDALPTSSRDSRVVDHDQDGNPGISLIHTFIDAYIGLRLKTEVQGTVGEDGVIRGNVDIDLDVTILGDSSIFVDAKKEWSKVENDGLVISEEHKLALTPIPSSAAFCPTVLEDYDDDLW